MQQFRYLGLFGLLCGAGSFYFWIPAFQDPSQAPTALFGGSFALLAMCLGGLLFAS